jgi:hypothetical protein
MLVKLTVALPVNKFADSYGTPKVYYRVHKNFPVDPISWLFRLSCHGLLTVAACHFVVQEIL